MLGFEEAFWALVTAVAAFVTWNLISDLRSAERGRRERQEMLRRLRERYERERFAEERLRAQEAADV